MNNQPSLPNLTAPELDGQECDWPHPFEPRTRHEQYHRYRGHKPCRQALMESAAERYYRKNGTLKGFVYKPLNSTYDCEWREDFIPNENHRSYHDNRKEPVCEQAKKERSAFKYQRKHGTLKGWVYYPKGVKFARNCDPHDDWEPNKGHIGYHERRGEPTCEQSRKECSAYKYLKEHGSLEGWEYYPNNRKYEWSCEYLGYFTPNKSHYAYHSRNQETACEQSLKEQSAFGYLQNYGTLDGWNYIPQLPADFNCEPHDNFEPNANHRRYHTRRGEPICEQSKKENAAYAFLQKYGWLGSWKYKHYDYVSQCDDEGPLIPHQGHHTRHKKAGEPPCERATLELSAYTHKQRHGTLEGWEPSLYKKGRNCRHRFYKITFPATGDWYYGITSQLIDIRITRHIDYESDVGLRMLSGELYDIEILGEAPTRREAYAVETLMIRSGNPHGRLLNRSSNPWYGLPPPHWGVAPPSIPRTAQTATQKAIIAQLAEPDRADCCGAPLNELEVTTKYRHRHRDGVVNISPDPCDAALR